MTQWITYRMLSYLWLLCVVALLYAGHYCTALLYMWAVVHLVAWAREEEAGL